MTVALRPARIRVPASTSNLGAGFDCIGLALDRSLEAEFEPGPAPLRVERAGTLARLAMDPGDDALVRAFVGALRLPDSAAIGGVIRMRSDIPVARGLGSSAAATVAGLLLAAAARGETEALDRAALLAEAARSEDHPDNAAPALFGGLVAVARMESGEPFAIPLPLSDRIGFVYAAPPVEVPTAQARRALPATVPHATAVRALARMAALLQGLATGEPELLRAGFTDELHVPYRLPLIPGAGTAMAAAGDAGAWAVTISGSGSGLIAVAPPDLTAAVAGAMAEAFRCDPGVRAALGRAPGSGRAGGPANADPADDVVAFPVRPDPAGAQVFA